MRILIDIGHPGHVHLFKHFGRVMQARGHQILFTCRQKEFETELLKAEGLPYVSFGRHHLTRAGKILGLVKFNGRMLREALRFKPDIFLSHGSIYAAQVAWLLKKPHVSLEDSGNMEQIRLYRPFSSCMLTPSFLPWDFGRKQIRYDGYHELAYLHPNWYKPDPSVRSLLGVAFDEPYAILRFVSWKATHDRGHKGLSVKAKNALVEFLSGKMKVFISSEAPLPGYLKSFQLKLAPERLHDALAYAEIVVSEGATLASESGILGTPAIYASSIKTYNNLEQEHKYGSVLNMGQEQNILERVRDVLNNHHSKDGGSTRKLIEDKIDVTSFLAWFVESFPKSLQVMRENPAYQDRFR